MPKQEIIQDETLFQRACGLWVERNIGQCVSSLMFDVGRNLEECSRIFDFNYDEAIGWFQREDYEEVVSDFIDDAEFCELEWIGEEFGTLVMPHFEGNVTDKQLEEVRAYVKTIISDNAEEIGKHFDLEPDYIEIYEHWIVDSSWFADQLKEYGQVVFEFGGLTIFGRCTTGQSLSLDGFLRRMVRDLPEDHWVWREA